jgi:hypothetical protein
MLRKFAAAAGAGLVLGAMSLSATALAAGPGASDCGRAAGQETSNTAQALGPGFGHIVSNLAPINDLNRQSLCLPAH